MTKREREEREALYSNVTKKRNIFGLSITHLLYQKMYASGFRRLSLNSKAFALNHPRCNIPKRTIMGSFFGGSDQASPLAGMLSSRLASMATDPEILVRITNLEN